MFVCGWLAFRLRRRAFSFPVSGVSLVERPRAVPPEHCFVSGSEDKTMNRVHHAYWREFQYENLGYLIEKNPAKEDNEIATPDVTVIHFIRS